MNKVIAFVIITAALISIFLPFQEFEGIWGRFDEAGNILEEEVNTNHLILGYELLFPIFVIAVIIVGTIFSGIVKNEHAKTIGFVFGCLGFALSVYVFILVTTPAEAYPHSIFHPPTPIIGIGSYVLLFTSVAGVVFASLRFSHS